jgi:hypothetical protein
VPDLKTLGASGLVQQMEGASMKLRILFGAAVLASSGATAIGLVGTTGIASAHPSTPAPRAYTCTGGDFASGTFTSIPSGNYASITVKGVCNIQPDAVIKVIGNINVAPGAVLDAQSAPSTINVGHDVTAGWGSLLGLGCQPANTIGMFAGQPCAVEPAGHTTITVRGNVTAIGANTVLMRGAVAPGAGKLTVNGNVTLIGGSTDNPWSIKGTTIGRNLTIIGVTAEFLGVQFNTIGGDATLLNITVNDVDSPPPGVTIVENTVARNLNCFGLVPGVSGGFISGEVNHVGHKATGQCAAISVPI